MDEKSYSPAAPSLNTACTRNPLRVLILATLIIIEAYDLDERLPLARPLPIILQFAAVGQRPFSHEASRVGREMAFNDLTGFDRNVRLVSTIRCKEVRWWMVLKKHP